MEKRKRIHSYITRSRFLHLEDALGIAKIRFFVGEYRKGAGANALAFHYLDLDDARVILSDLSWGKAVQFTDYKGTTNGDGPQSRVLKINAKDGKVWIEIHNGPGEVIGQGAIKPQGKPTASVSVPLESWDARKLAHAALAYIRAWENEHLVAYALTGPISPDIPDATPGTTRTPPPPDAFPSPSEAIAWGYLAGRFDDIADTLEAYEKVRLEKNPANAYEMRAVWVAHCDVRRSKNVI